MLILLVKKLSNYDATMEDLDNEIKSIVTYLDTKRSPFRLLFILL